MNKQKKKETGIIIKRKRERSVDNKVYTYKSYK